MGLKPSLPKHFFQSDDVVQIARSLLGMELHTQIDGQHCSARICETEAYRSYGDAACHAHLGRRSKRTEIMYQAGGVAYVYLCYGIHHLFNIVCNVEGVADAVLIRAAEPLEGIEQMRKRRGPSIKTHRLLAGPGNLSKGLGITTADYGAELQTGHIWITQGEKSVGPIVESARIGVDYAGADALLPWRFYLGDSPAVSRR